MLYKMETMLTGGIIDIMVQLANRKKSEHIAGGEGRMYASPYNL